MEVWKPLRNFPGYEGSTEGRIRNVRTQKIQKPFPDKKGTMKVNLYINRKRYNVRPRKAIAETFLGPHPGMDVRHRDGDQSNTRPDNLEWCTRSETITDTYKRGTKKPRRSKKSNSSDY